MISCGARIRTWISASKEHGATVTPPRKVLFIVANFRLFFYHLNFLDNFSESGYYQPMPERLDQVSFLWPKEFDSSLEKIIDLGPFVLIAKPIRLTKAERDLSALAPRNEDIRQFFQLRDVYKMRIDPAGTAGYHYHNQKIEIIYPLNDLILCFYDLKTREGRGILVPERIGDTTFGFLIKPEVAHTIINPSREDEAFYVVLSNMFEEDAQKVDDVIDFKFDLPPAKPLQFLWQGFEND